MNNATYEYDRNGVRTKKHLTWTNVTKEYFYDGDKLICEKHSDGNTLYFFYDESGVCGMRYNGVNYEFVRNIFGDVLGIYNEGILVAAYAYDAWGNITQSVVLNDIGNINPFRYRGYYYDSESGLYYLQSRYYDPSVGQFISMDTPDYLDPVSINGLNIYAYGLNNPVMYVDPTGHAAIVNSFENKFFLGNILLLGLEAFGKLIEHAKPFVDSAVESFYCSAGVGGGIGIEVEFSSLSISLLAAIGVGIEVSTEELKVGYFDKRIAGVSIGEMGGVYGVDELSSFEEELFFSEHQIQDTTISVGASFFFGLGAYVEVGFNVSKFFRLLEEYY